MNAVIRLLCLLLCVCTVLMGCSRTTTVILPPETAAHTAKPTAEQKEPATAAPTTAPTRPPATQRPTEPPTAEPTAPPTESPTRAPTQATEPPVPPATEEPSTQPPRHPVYDIGSHSIGSPEYSLLDGINGKRSENELAPLTLNSKLCALAAIRAYECASDFSHTRPDGRGAYTVLSDYGYAVWSNFSERIHYGSSGLSASTIVKGWMYNGDFSGDILSDGFTHIGIGVYRSNGITYIVCFFAG